MSSLRQLLFASLVAALVVLTGCANVQPKVDSFEQQSRQLGTIYGQVNKVTPSEDWGYCDSSRVSRQVKSSVCKSGVNAVQVSWVSKGKSYAVTEAIPNTVKLEPGAIVVLDMTRSFAAHFVSVASEQETDVCHWDGKSNALNESSFKKAAVTVPAFLAGALMPIPAVAYLVSTRNDLGGVVCDGWNYQEAYKDKDIDALINIF